MAVQILVIKPDQAGQRIDNFLFTRLKGLPKSRIYRAIRNGEVRVNKGRIKPEYRIQANDSIRIPPLKIVPTETATLKPSTNLLNLLQQSIIYENEGLLIINKPSGIPVHGGSQVNIGLIESLRVLRPQARFLELVHRLDQETSGCLMIAKKRQVLLELHKLLIERQVKKQYLVLVKGRWEGGQRKVQAPLLKNTYQGGERKVIVHDEGKPAVTLFRPYKKFAEATLLEAFPVTGRTHQIRVHAACIGYPVAGDEKYGDPEFNKQMRKSGLKRLFLHSAGIMCRFNQSEGQLGICAQLDTGLKNCLENLTPI